MLKFAFSSYISISRPTFSFCDFILKEKRTRFYSLWFRLLAKIVIIEIKSQSSDCHVQCSQLFLCDFLINFEVGPSLHHPRKDRRPYICLLVDEWERDNIHSHHIRIRAGIIRKQNLHYVLCAYDSIILLKLVSKIEAHQITLFIESP